MGCGGTLSIIVLVESSTNRYEIVKGTRNYFIFQGSPSEKKENFGFGFTISRES